MTRGRSMENLLSLCRAPVTLSITIRSNEGWASQLRRLPFNLSRPRDAGQSPLWLLPVLIMGAFDHR
jgi:hypothetical protein